MGNIVTLENVEKTYGSNKVVKCLNMEIKEGEFLTLLGPSGCGKTTTLRMIAGFEEASSGRILVEGEDVEKKEPYQRNVNTVFQSYALFPHMNIYDNIAYGLKIKGVKQDEISERVSKMLDLVCLKGFEKRKPSQLSGGQKQRVAIARALINRPKVLLLDEPLGALDLKLRKQMQLELKRLQKKLQITFIYVTHDQEEALTMSDRIAIMNGGVLEQLDTSKEIYNHPKTRFVASFIGESNIFDGVVQQTEGNIVRVGTECGHALCEGEGYQINESVVVSVRPENMKFSSERKHGYSLYGTVKEVVFVGNMIKANIGLPNGNEVKLMRLPDEEIPSIGDKVFLSWDPSKGVLIKNRDDAVYKYLDKLQREVITDGREKKEK